MFVETIEEKLFKNRLELPVIGNMYTKSLNLSAVSLFPAENVYESAAKLLFLAVKWARTIPSFLQVALRLVLTTSIQNPNYTSR